MGFLIAQLLRVEAAAEILDVSVSQIYRNWRRWELPGLMVGGGLRFAADELDRWIEDQVEAERQAGRQS